MIPILRPLPKLARLRLALVSGCALAGLARADPPSGPPPPLLGRFALAPRSMQVDPLLDITVMTDVTDAGKKLPPVTKDRPAYYLAQSEGFKEVGEGIPSGETLGEEDMGRLLRHSLADGGYLEAQTAGRPPTLLILYRWGLYSKEVDYGQGADATAIQTKEAIERAEMIGGDEFALKYMKMLRWKSTVGASSTNKHHTSNISDPMYIYRLEGRAHDFMIEMVNSDLYYVVASAYDYAAYRQRKPVLLWRTRIAIDANGISQPQVLPTMVLGASDYFGKQTHGDPAILERHAAGHVEIGEIKVVSFGTPTEAPEAPPPTGPAPAASGAAK